MKTFRKSFVFDYHRGHVCVIMISAFFATAYWRSKSADSARTLQIFKK